MRSLFLFLAACSASPPPDEVTPEFVGTEKRTVPGPGEVTLTVQAWFPAIRVVDAPYSYDGIIEGEASIALESGCTTPLPVVVFSHGNGGIRYQSLFLTEYLASQGFIVIAPDHVGNTLSDLGAIPRSEVAVRRPQDVAATFDGLVAWSQESDSPIAGCVDPSAGYAVAGHSFGAYTSLVVAGGRLDLEGLAASCDQGGFLCGADEAYRDAFPDGDGDLSDPRAWAAIPMTPVALPGVALEEVRTPTYVIGGLEDTLTTWDEQVYPTYAGLDTAPRYLAGLADTGHYSFTDFCALNPSWNGCEDSALDLATVHELTRSTALAFLGSQLDEGAGWEPPEHPQLTWEFVE